MDGWVRQRALWYTRHRRLLNRSRYERGKEARRTATFYLFQFPIALIVSSHWIRTDGAIPTKRTYKFGKRRASLKSNGPTMLTKGNFTSSSSLSVHFSHVLAINSAPPCSYNPENFLLLSFFRSLRCARSNPSRSRRASGAVLFRKPSAHGLEVTNVSITQKSTLVLININYKHRWLLGGCRESLCPEKLPPHVEY